MGKTYLQVDEKYYDWYYKTAIAKELDESGQIDFTKGFEYFNVDNDTQGKPIYEKSSPRIKCWFTRRDAQYSIENVQPLNDVIQKHLLYDQGKGYSTDILREKAKTLSLERGLSNDVFGGGTAAATYISLSNKMFIYGYNEKNNSHAISHEVGHMKLCKVIFDGNKLVITTGLMEQTIPVDKIRLTKEGDQLIILGKDLHEVGRGLEESVNEVETVAISHHTYHYPSFGPILAALLGEKVYLARHNMSRNELIEALRTITPSLKEANDLIIELDAYFKERMETQYFNRDSELEAYLILGDYILKKALLDIKAGSFKEEFINQSLNWVITHKANKQDLLNMQKEIRRKIHINKY